MVWADPRRDRYLPGMFSALCKAYIYVRTCCNEQPERITLTLSELKAKSSAALMADADRSYYLRTVEDSQFVWRGQGAH